jgi:hypothetical protein
MKILKPFLLTLLLPLVVMAQPKFIITGSENSFTAKDDGETIIAGAENQPIQDVIDAIRDECSDGCEIQFENGTNVLDIGSSYIEFEGNWGEITLTGKITANKYETISIYEGVSVVSEANIKNTSNYYSIAIRNEGGMLTIIGGNIEAEYYAVDNNEGELTIIGGNIKAENCAVNNHGKATINNGNIEAEMGAVCNHYTELTIAGGNIKAESCAVVNDGDILGGESSLITIKGGNIEAEYGAVCNSGGEITIIDGSIKAKAGAVTNGYEGGKITIRGGNIEAEYEAVINDCDKGEITISGGNIKAIVAAVINYEGKLTISGGNIKAMAVAVLNLDIRALALNALKLAITGGSISIIDGYIPLELISSLKDLLEDFLDAVELAKDFSKYAVYFIGNEDYFSLSGDAIIDGEVKSNVDKNSPILLPQIANSQISIKTTANTIVFENLPNNAKIDIYNSQGKLISNKSFNQANNGQITVQAKGIYFARIGTQTFRIAVK